MITGRAFLIAALLVAGAHAHAETDMRSAALRERQAMTGDVFKLSSMMSCMKAAARRGPLSLARASGARQEETNLSCWRDQQGNCYFMANETDPNTGRRMALDVVVRGEKVIMPAAAMTLYHSQVAARTAAALGACRAAA